MLYLHIDIKYSFYHFILYVILNNINSKRIRRINFVTSKTFQESLESILGVRKRTYQRLGGAS